MISLIKYPKRWKALLITLAASIVLHAVVIITSYVAPFYNLYVGFSGIEFVEEEYDPSLMDIYKIGKPLKYPGNYLGFKFAKKQLTEEEIKKQQQAYIRKQEAHIKREEVARKKLEAEQAKVQAEVAEKSKKDKGYAGFGKINTKPIRDQIEQLYTAYKKGQLSLTSGRIKIGIKGKVNPDGSLSNYEVFESSGTPEIDKAAMGVMASISESRAMGPLSVMSSLVLILSVDKNAELTIVGFTENETDAENIAGMANGAILLGKFRKSNDPAAMVMLNNLKVRRSGQRIEAVIQVPRQTATDVLNKTMAPKTDPQGKS